MKGEEAVVTKKPLWEGRLDVSAWHAFHSVLAIVEAMCFIFICWIFSLIFFNAGDDKGDFGNGLVLFCARVIASDHPLARTDKALCNLAFHPWMPSIDAGFAIASVILWTFQLINFLEGFTTRYSMYEDSLLVESRVLWFLRTTRIFYCDVTECSLQRGTLEAWTGTSFIKICRYSGGRMTKLNLSFLKNGEKAERVLSERVGAYVPRRLPSDHFHRD